MTLRTQFTDALKTSMKAGDSARTSTLRMILAKVKDADIAARPAEQLNDDQVTSVLRGMVKSRRESVEMYTQGNRPELAAKEEAEIAVIEGFLPQQMDEAAVKAAVDAAIAETGAAGPKDMGRVMAALKAKHAASLDMARATPLVKARLGPDLMALPPAFLDELRARTPMPALVGRKVKLSRSGKSWKGCCPFHGEKTPSFYVYDDGYHCFGCGAHGDAIGFVMNTEGAGFIEAVERLAGEAGLDVPKPSPAAAEAERERLDVTGVLDLAAASFARRLHEREGREALAYLRGRGLTDETIQRFGLGWSGEGRGDLVGEMGRAGVDPSRLAEAGLLQSRDDGAVRELFYNRVMFPIRDRRGRTISFGGRALGDAKPKYINGPETAVYSKSRTLYALDLAREGARKSPHGAIVAEGYMDVISLHQAGFGGAVAPCGTALTTGQLEELWRLSDAPVLCFDGDAAGARAAARAADLALPMIASDRTLCLATLPAGEDPDTLVRRGGSEAFATVLAGKRPLAVALFDLLREGSSADTPEGRAALMARLDGAAARIADKTLAGQYRSALRDRFYEQTRRRKGPAPARATAVPRGIPGAATNEERHRPCW